jgi:hypothetical protein
LVVLRICHHEAKRAPSAIVKTSVAGLSAPHSTADTRIFDLAGENTCHAHGEGLAGATTP